MFAKLLSISDDLMWRYFTLLQLSHAKPEIAQLQRRGRGRAQPEGRQGAAGQGDHRALPQRGRGRARPKPTSTTARAAACPTRSPKSRCSGAPLGIGALLKQANLAPSSSEAMRLVDRRGVRIDGAVVSDKGLKLGRRHLRRAGRQAQVRAGHGRRMNRCRRTLVLALASL